MKFIAYGHRNVLATHPTTLEFTKEDFLTLKGDCILGINADFKNPHWKTQKKIKILLAVDNFHDEITAEFNPGFKSTKAMVIRKSSYIDDRTFAINANKAANDIKRDLVKLLKDPSKKVSVGIINLKL